MSEAPPPEKDTLLHSAVRRVDQICDRFEDALKAGRQPRIEAYLGNEAEPEYSVLLRELLSLELHYCRLNGVTLSAEKYLALFPRHRELIAALFWPAVPGYRIESELGRGGMGVVYKAWHSELERFVAIKILLPGAPVDRFRREAKLLAKVNSPFVVTIHDFDVLPNGSPMLVMEWVKGTDLLDTIRSRGGPLTEEESLQWMRQTSEGMLAAADEGIIHRDFKPSNVLIDGKGLARVADFGLARGPKGLGDLTLIGGMMGTPLYVAPEQAEDPRLVDTRADIYSFGATFYHALTGVPPFSGETVFSILFKHKTEPLIPPKARNHALSERTSDFLERCLAKSPQDRFPSFAEILKQLRPPPDAPFAWDASDDPELAPYLERYQTRREAYLSLFKNDTTEGDTYEFAQGRELRILSGNIVQQDVEAIVSSDDTSLSMGGGVSAWIRKAAGSVMVREAQRYVRVRPGRAVVTSGGRLVARFVFHGVTMGTMRGQFVRPSRDVISEILASCFYHADSLGIQSIAFPLLGTGSGGFSQAVCLDTTFRFLARMLLRGLTSVQAARIVIFE
jgi:eukaryotic-like serine/threonine-protein kinase